MRLPIYTQVGMDGFQMYPGLPDRPGIHHDIEPGLHLVAGVDGLGKTTFLFLLYNGLVGPAAVKNDDFGVPQPELVARRAPRNSAVASRMSRGREGRAAFHDRDRQVRGHPVAPRPVVGRVAAERERVSRGR